MELLYPALQTYPWGSRTLLAQMRGENSPSVQPEAELWFGAHRAAPAQAAGMGLDVLIAADPERALGPRVRAAYSDELPFLLKVLAADSPLSVQAHPTREQAEAGFHAENAAGIALSSPYRNYTDPNHKPELLVALTPFRALAGLRPAAQTLELFNRLNCPTLDRYAVMLESDDEAGGLRAIFTTWISLPRAKRVQLIDDIATCIPAASTDGWMDEAAQCFLELNDKHPGDVGVLASLLLNYVVLAPGEALFLGAGRLHAYLSGMAVEIMASSDNILRGGLTTKHVDVPELVRILDFSTLADPRIPTTTVGYDTEFPVPIADFVLTRHALRDNTVTVDTDGPAIILCTAGQATCGDLTFSAGQAVWMPAADPAAVVRAKGECADIFYARA